MLKVKTAFGWCVCKYGDGNIEHCVESNPTTETDEKNGSSTSDSVSSVKTA